MKRIYTICIGLLTILSSLTSLTGQGWETIFGVDTLHDQVEAIVETPDNGFAFTGRQNSDFAAFAKVDAQGDVQWQEPPSDPNAARSHGYDIINTSDGGLIITGDKFDVDLNINMAFVEKRTANGDLEWSTNYSFAETPISQNINEGTNIIQTSDGGYLITGTHYDFPNDYVSLLKIDAQGNEQWKGTYGSGSQSDDPVGLFEKGDGTFEVVGYSEDENTDTYIGYFFLKVDAQGTELSFITTNYENEALIGALEANAGGYLLATPDKLIKIDDQGAFEWESSFSAGPDGPLMEAINHTNDGNLILAGVDDLEFLNIIKIDESGNGLWSRGIDLDNQPYWVHDILNTSDDSYLIAGRTVDLPNTLRRDFWLYKLDPNSLIFNHYLKGNIYLDQNANCIKDPGEQGMNGYLVEADGLTTYYGTSIGNEGSYGIPIDTGEFSISPQINDSPYWAICPESSQLNLQGINDTTIQDFALQPLVDCPLMTVDISAPFIRRCFESTYTVSYCNNGTVPAQEAFVEILIDPFMDFTSATLPVTNQVGNLYTFDLGNVDVNDCGSFKITVIASCEAEDGQTHCTEAHIYPDELCGGDAIWEGPVVAVEGNCNEDSIHFIITNIGADMPGEHQYIVTEDNIILMQEPFQLNSGESYEFSVPISGSSTYRLAADQAEGYPPFLGNNQASVSLEGCNGVNPGFVIIYPEDDLTPFLSIDCQENVGAYDPNDKRGFPKGYGAEHFIERNIDIEYHVRFQNTGTDTAFTVVIRDTLDKKLDITSIRPGAASHDYEYEIYGQGIIQFTFNNILLPDSNVNEPASHGFVKFRASQKEDLPLGTIIHNSAGIYFDFNDPVITNETWHTIGENFIISDVVPEPTFEEVEVKISPNPFTDQALIRVEQIELKNASLLLHNASGQLIKKFSFQNNQAEIDAAELQSGIYFFQIINEGRRVATGKLMLQ